MNKFWIVAKDTGQLYASKRHSLLAEAISEASRLCTIENHPFIVFEATHIVKPQQPPVSVEELSIEDILPY